MPTHPALTQLFWVLQAFFPQRGVHSVVNRGVVVKTRWHSNALSRSILVRRGPLGCWSSGIGHESAKTTAISHCDSCDTEMLRLVCPRSTTKVSRRNFCDAESLAKRYSETCH